jgi:hypothetical protein
VGESSLSSASSFIAAVVPGAPTSVTKQTATIT